MKETGQDYIGYVRYHGKAVQSGIFDAKDAAEALLGTDEILRFFVKQKDPKLSQKEFNLPVRIQERSWGIIIPTVLTVGASAFIVSYAKKLGETAATVGLFESGTAKDIGKIIQGAITTLNWVVRIRKHRKRMGEKEIPGSKFIENNKFLLLPSPDGGEPLSVPVEAWEAYTKVPGNLMNKVASLVQEGRELEIAVAGDDGSVDRAAIGLRDKSYFIGDESEDEMVCPELEHGDWVELEGTITRSNVESNTLGFRYREHTLTCKPASGSISQFKETIISTEENKIYTQARIYGQVNRLDRNGYLKKFRPEILITEIDPIDPDELELNFERKKS